MNYNQIEQNILAQDRPIGPGAIIRRLLSASRSALRESLNERKTFYDLRQRRLRNASNPDAIFIWVPKSAGSSVMRLLQNHSAETVLTVEGMRAIKNFKGIYSFGHLNVFELLKHNLLDLQFFTYAFKFALVRNPYDRAVSLYEYLRKICVLAPTTTFSIFCRYIEGHAFEPNGLHNRIWLSQLNTQSSWLYDANGKQIFDYVGKLESLEESLAVIRQRLSINIHTIPRENTSRRMAMAAYYDNDSIRIVRDVYHEDFVHFDYNKDDLPISEKKVTENKAVTYLKSHFKE